MDRARAFPAGGRSGRRLSRLQRQERTAAWLFLLPSLVIFSVFVAFPVLAALGISFTSWDLFTTPAFVGVQNYQELLGGDPLFGQVLRNTALYVLGTVPVQMVIALGVALALNRRVPGQAFFRVAYFLPVVSSTVAIALVWSWLFNSNYGILNSLLVAIGIQDPPRWLSSSAWALPALMIVSIWQSVGYSMVLFLAGLQNIPAELYEAGSIDGAVGWARLRHLTLPLLSPTTFFVLTVSLIGSFQVFELAFVMTGGGPANATNTLVYYIYQNAFLFFRMGYATAAAWILFVIVFTITLLQYRAQRLWVHYE